MSCRSALEVVSKVEANLVGAGGVVALMEGVPVGESGSTEDGLPGNVVSGIVSGSGVWEKVSGLYGTMPVISNVSGN